MSEQFLMLFNSNHLNQMSFIHPECREDEIFLTNSISSGYRGIGWNTKRTGDVAYNTDCKPINEKECEKYFPVFVKKDEIKKAIDEADDDEKEILKRFFHM